MTNKKAVFDVDGVLLDCETPFLRLATVVLGRPLVALNNAYDFGVRYGLSENEVMRVFEEMKAHPEGWGGLPSLPGAADAFNRLKGYGYEIHLVTAIPEDIRSIRNACLVAHGMVADEIHCAGHHRAGKADIIRAIDPIMFVDDRLRHLHESNFVPYRVFVENDADQDGYVVDESVVCVRNLASWIRSWALARGYDSQSTVELA